MLPDSTWSSLFKKSKIELSSAEILWKDFMIECLMGTEIFRKSENENESSLIENPNFLMDVRHRMVKQSKKIISMPQVLIHSEALQLLRRENYNRLLKQKEGKMVKNEITKLKQMLDKHRLFAEKKIKETIDGKSNSISNIQIYPKHSKLQKRLETLSKTCSACNLQCERVNMTVKPKASQNTNLYKIKGSLKQEEPSDDLSVPISISKGSTRKNESESDNQSWKTDEVKNESKKKFSNNKWIPVEQESCYDLKESEKIREKPQLENFLNTKRLEHAWNIWKAYIQKLKIRKRERTIYHNKIEAFVIKLKENETREEKLKDIRCMINLKEDIGPNSMVKNRAEKMKKVINDKEKEEGLKKLMKEIKISQLEAQGKLKEFRKIGQEKFENSEFLKKIEERRTERLKRRKEIEEKKRRIEEERAWAEREEEKEKRRQEEECKRKSLEKLKEKRRLEKERKEEQKKAREKWKLAENHYEKYILRSYGLRPWSTLIKIRDSQNQHSLAFFESKLKRKVFSKWTSIAREQITLKIKRSDAFHEMSLKKKCFAIWHLFYKEKIRQNQVAADWNEFKIIEGTFRKWLNFTQHARIDYLNKKYAAELNYERKLKLKCLTKLKDYPELKKLEQDKENRKKKWRQKVQEILPDYRPIDIPDQF